MTKKIELNLNQESFFRILEFFGEADCSPLFEGDKDIFEKMSESGKSEAQAGIMLGQAVLKVVGRSKDATYRLFADLAGVTEQEIRSLSPKEFIGLIKSFIQAPLFREALEDLLVQED